MKAALPTDTLAVEAITHEKMEYYLYFQSYETQWKFGIALSPHNFVLSKQAVYSFSRQVRYVFFCLPKTRIYSALKILYETYINYQRNDSIHGDFSQSCDYLISSSFSVTIVINNRDK